MPVMPVSLLLLAAAAQPSTQWPTYLNARFGFSTCYPAALLKPLPESDNGDGRVFVGARKSALRVYGRNNALERTTAQEYAAEQDRIAKAGARISYKAAGKGWFVVSGSYDGLIFYAKTYAVPGDQFNTFELTYPASEAKSWNAIVTRVNRCFAPSRR